MQVFSLQNSFLLRIDYACDKPNYHACRFVDDYCLFGSTKANVAWQNEQLETMFSELGLVVNVSKSEFGVCAILADRLAHFDNMVGRFQQTTLKHASVSSLQKIQIAMRMLREEFNDFDIDRYAVNYLLATIRNNMKTIQSVPDTLLQELFDCYIDHSVRAANALAGWLPIFNSNIRCSPVQELLGKIILEKADMLDTELAFCYGSFSLTTMIHNASLRQKLVERFERDASRPITHWSGSNASRKGKSLRALQQHGQGNDLLMDVFRKNNYYQEMRRYTAVAATSLPVEQMQEFFYTQLLACINPEERFLISQLQKYNEVDSGSGRGSSVTYPDSRRRFATSKY